MSGPRIEAVTPAIGAEVTGVDLSQPLDAATVSALHDALMDHQVLFFRDQSLDVDQLRRFGESFGAPHIHPLEPGLEGCPGIMSIHTDAQSETFAGSVWHSDVSFDAQPPMGSILHLHQTPECGGDTLFANMYAAYEALSAPFREFLSKCTAVHDSQARFRGYFRIEADEYPKSEHPVARTHPVTGRKALFVNQGFTSHIVGLEAGESRALLEFLYAHIGSPRFQCRFQWRPNSLAFWDNRCAQHMALWDYYPETRSGYRFTVAGDRPI